MKNKNAVFDAQHIINLLCAYYKDRYTKPENFGADFEGKIPGMLKEAYNLLEDFQDNNNMI